MKFKIEDLDGEQTNETALANIKHIYTQLKKIKLNRVKDIDNEFRFSYFRVLTYMHICILEGDYINADDWLDELLHFHYNGKKGLLNKGLHISLLQELKPLCESEEWDNVL